MNILGTMNRLTAASALVVLSSSLAFASSHQPAITHVKGSVVLNDSRAQKGDVIAPGSIIRTGARSTADIFLADNGPTVQVLENTEVTIEELSSDASDVAPVINTKLSLTAGKISGYVKKTSPSSSYTVTTPTATAAIRGTVYMISSEGYVWVWDGCVDITFNAPGGGTNEYVVCSGQMFDPFLMTVVSNDVLSPHLVLPSSLPPVPPVGPVLNLSPVIGTSTGPQRETPTGSGGE
jgi:hypothetical protein